MRIKSVPVALLLALFVVAAARSLPAGERHLALVKSAPANAATLAKSPKVLQLWFSQRPNLKLTRVVLTGPKRDTLKTSAPTVADSTGTHILVALDAALSAGKYEVTWRTLSRDGHAVAGKFTFAIDPTANAARTAALSRKPR